MLIALYMFPKRTDCYRARGMPFVRAAALRLPSMILFLGHDIYCLPDCVGKYVNLLTFVSLITLVNVSIRLHFKCNFTLCLPDLLNR